MIIKTGGIASGDGARICNYVVAEGDNERVEVLTDSNDQLLIADDFAQLRGRKNGLLHIIISPDEELTPDELAATVSAIRAEFGFDSDDPETLAVHESKRSDGSTQKHYHLVRPAQNSETGRTYKLFKSKAKDEALSRLSELQFGHKLTSGAHNQFAEMRLREQGKDELADKLAAELGDDERPRAAFSHGQHQQAKRNCFDLPKLRHQLTTIAALPRDQQPAALAELIDSNGLELAAAIEEGRGRSRINIKLPGDLKDHNANRTLKIKAAEVAAFIAETKGHLHDRRSEHIESRSDLNPGSTIADHRGSGTDSSEQPSHDPAPERFAEGAACDLSKLKNEADELAQAANELRPQATQFADNRAGDLTAGDIDAPPDINDPNLMKRLAAMLKKSLGSTARTAGKIAGAAFKPGQGMPG